MQLLVLFLAATVPLQFLPTFMIAAKVSYRPFLIISSLSTVEEISIFYVVVAKLGILGATIAQVTSVLLASVLYLIFSVKQNILPLDRREAFTLVLIALSFLSLINWAVALLLLSLIHI